jgi:hypothetical protein
MNLDQPIIEKVMSNRSFENKRWRIYAVFNDLCKEVLEAL